MKFKNFIVFTIEKKKKLAGAFAGDDDNEKEKQINGVAHALKKLGVGGKPPSARAAQIILKLLADK